VLRDIESVRDRIRQTTVFTVQTYLSDHSELALFLPLLTEEEESICEEHPPATLSVLINLGSTLLFLTNYYVVAPTAAEYAEALGGSKSMTGIIVGMTPVAACVSAFVYSSWTNSSYKQPMVFCCVSQIVGNVIYAMALDADAFWMTTVGRLIVGLAGPRAINRRYITDLPKSMLSSGSAAFVTSSAMGMAAGPFIAAVLAYQSVVDSIRSFTPSWMDVTTVTLPGWVMVLMWTVYTVFVIAFFEEPHRILQAKRRAAEEGETYRDELEDDVTHEPILSHADSDADDFSAGELRSFANVNYGSIDNHPVELPVLDQYRKRESCDVVESPASGSMKRSSSVPDSLHWGRGSEHSDDPIFAKMDIIYEHRQLRTPRRASGAPAGDSDDEDKSSQVTSGTGTATDTSTAAATAVLYWQLRLLAQAPILIMLFMYFLNKLIVEMCLTSASIFTEAQFGWSHSEAGFMLAAMALLVLPTNALLGILVGKSGENVSDTTMLLCTQVAVLVGCLVIMMYPEASYTPVQYLLGFMITFVSLQINEGIAMALLAKSIPVELASGILNSGLLATEAGTAGRAVGDFYISVAGADGDIVALLNRMFLPMAISMAVMLALSIWYRKQFRS